MDLAEIVIGHVQGNGGFEVFKLLAESVCEPGETAAMHPQGVVLLLDVGRADLLVVRCALLDDFLNGANLGREKGRSRKTRKCCIASNSSMYFPILRNRPSRRYSPVSQKLAQKRFGRDHHDLANRKAIGWFVWQVQHNLEGVGTWSVPGNGPTRLALTSTRKSTSRLSLSRR